MADVLLSDSGEGAELRDLLMTALSVPPNATSFDVSFMGGQPVRVRCEYLPLAARETHEDLVEPEVPDAHRGLNG